MRYARFLAPILLFIPAFLGMWTGGLWAWVVPLVSFVMIPVVEMFHEGSVANLSAEEEAVALEDRGFDLLLFAVVPLQVALLGSYLWAVSAGTLSALGLLGATATMGIACGVYGINVAHELGHRREALHLNLSKILLWTTLYQHFHVEHNRGHHRRVATPDDPASSFRGQTVYAFWWRSITGGYRSAWDLENQRVTRDGSSWLTWDNEMVRFTVYQGVAMVAVLAVLGPLAMVAWLLVGLMGALLLETVNYLEHYGLRRERTERGAYERVRPVHSWNANRELGRVFLFELTRHSDHHAHATRPYQVLRHIEGAPQLPAGYPTLVLLALAPPLFFAMMDPALDAWEQQHRAVAA